MFSSKPAPLRSCPVQVGGLVDREALSVWKFYRVDTTPLHDAALLPTTLSLAGKLRGESWLAWVDS